MAEPAAVELTPDQWAYVLAAINYAIRDFRELPYPMVQGTVRDLRETFALIRDQLGLPLKPTDG